jgi:DNA-binding transcriptional MerR regulator
MTAQTLRIGDLARLAGTTARTIRYYEEIGLLPDAAARMAGSHRLYDDADLERLREVMRLKSLLGVSLDELKELIEAEDARAALRSELSRDDVEPDRRRALLIEAQDLLVRQLELVRLRAVDLQRLDDDLSDRLVRVRLKLAELDSTPQPAVAKA